VLNALLDPFFVFEVTVYDIKILSFPGLDLGTHIMLHALKRYHERKRSLSSRALELGSKNDAVCLREDRRFD
jgi:hypothetical protein